MAGYNYAEKYYEEHHRTHPDWVIYGSETSSIVHSRGIYHFPMSAAILSDDDRQCSALGNSATSWSARSYEDCVTMDRDMSFSMGQFLWTGFDYIGEPTPYRTKNSYFGQLDTAGLPKDAYYVWQAAWTDVHTAPMVHVFPYWDFNRGQLIDVRVVSNADVVELYLNGESLGRQELDNRPGSGSHIIAGYQIPYTEGRLTARGYLKEPDGALKQVAEETRHSFGNSAKLVIDMDWCSDGLAYLIISTLDQDGYPVENAVDRVRVSVTGAGRLVGLDNGDSTDEDSYQGLSRRLFSGKLVAIIAPGQEPGDIEVRAEGEGLMGATYSFSFGDGIASSELYHENTEHEILTGNADEVPVRRITISPEAGVIFDEKHRELGFGASVEPSSATDKHVIWRAITDGGVDTNLVSLNGSDERALVRALGDGHFRLRAESMSGTEDIRVISELECEITGLGPAFLDPYSFVSGSLYTRCIGEVGPGNERGVASARDGETVIIFDDLDFGRAGSDRITMPIFALDDKEYSIKLYRGVPGEEGAALIGDLRYQKPSIWNTYQPETWDLTERLVGRQTLSVAVDQKFHLKGFSFERFLKGFGLINAAEADAIYGDSFVKGEKAITGIGNNVSLEYTDIDFGERSATSLTVKGHTPNTVNTIHALLERDGVSRREILEFKHSEDYEEQSFTLSEPATGSFKLTFVFLPGSNFDLESFRFS